MLVLDSNTISYYFRGDPQVVQRLQALRPADLGVPAIVEYELRYGLLRLPNDVAAPRLAALAQLLRPMQLLPFDREPLINSHMAATAVWRDEMQGVARSQGLFSLTRHTTRQFARQTPSRRANFARYQRGGCGQIGRSLPCAAWHRSPGYDLRRTRRDLPDLTRNAAHGGINQRFQNVPPTPPAFASSLRPRVRPSGRMIH